MCNIVPTNSYFPRAISVEIADTPGAAPAIQDNPISSPDAGQTGNGEYRVILYDDDWHGQEEVVLQIQKATGCNLSEATRIMWEAHTRGRAICFRGTRARCHEVARVLREIRLQCEVDCD